MTGALRLHLFAAAVAVALPTIASAQIRPAPPPANWFYGGLGGFAFGTSPSGAYGAQTGARVMTSMDIVVEVGYVHDVLPTSLRDGLNATLDAMSASTGTPVRAALRLPSIYGLAGARWVARSSRSARPFV